jgi:hypothetical protein
MGNLNGRGHFGKNKAGWESSAETSLHDGWAGLKFIFIVCGFWVMNVWAQQKMRTS